MKKDAGVELRRPAQDEDVLSTMLREGAQRFVDQAVRALAIPPRLAVGHDALGFWAAIEEIYPETRHQRCWKHKTVNVLNYLPRALSNRRFLRSAGVI